MPRELVVGGLLLALFGAAGLAAFSWYINTSGLYQVFRDSRGRRQR